MKKVLIALDYDPTAQKVAETGFLLAKTMKAKVTLLHVISEQDYYYTPEFSSMGLTGEIGSLPLPIGDKDQLKNTALDFLHNTKEYLGDKTIAIILKEGRLADSILDTAKELSADIIVMGSHSRKWLEKIVMGSSTESVLRKTTLPLFIVPTKKEK